LFELFMKMRRDFADARFRALADDLKNCCSLVRHLRRRYREQYAFDSGLAIQYVDSCFGKSYEDASRMAREYVPLGPAMVKWKYRPDADARAEELGWTGPAFDDSDWPVTHVVEETWSSIGHHNTIGRMVYRVEQRLAAAPEGKRAWLWIGATDGSAKVYVNGRHVRYVVPESTRRHAKGQVLDAFAGFCEPARFDVTDAVQPGLNRIAIVCERTWLNEVGTGGLMGPVVVFRER